MGAQEASGCAQIIVVCGEQEKALPFLMLSSADRSEIVYDQNRCYGILVPVLPNHAMTSTNLFMSTSLINFSNKQLYIC